MDIHDVFPDISRETRGVVAVGAFEGSFDGVIVGAGVNPAIAAHVMHAPHVVFVTGF